MAVVAQTMETHKAREHSIEIMTLVSASSGKMPIENHRCAEEPMLPTVLYFTAFATIFFFMSNLQIV